MILTLIFSVLGKRISAVAPTTGDITAAQKHEDAAQKTVAASGVAMAGPDFARVYDEYFGFVWRNVLNRGVPPSAVDDVVQEVFIVVHRKLGEFEGRSSLKTWLAGIARRVVSDHVRKRGNAPAGDPLDADLDVASVLAGPAEALDAKVAARIVDDLLALMTEDQREVFVLHEIEEMSGREIAQATGTNENTVHTRLRAARKVFHDGIARLETR